MTTSCYAMVRGEAIRVTGLTPRGRLPMDKIEYGVSKGVARVEINEMNVGGSNSLARHEGTDTPLMRETRSAETIRFLADLRFNKVDASMLSLMTNVPVALNAAGDVVGFDAMTRLPAAAFALEVWTRLAKAPLPPTETVGFGAIPFGAGPFGGEQVVPISYDCGIRTPYSKGFGEMRFGKGPFGRSDRPKKSLQWGYTLFPFLKGGYLTGFSFGDGTVSFNLVGAQTRRGGEWGVGPHDFDGYMKRLDKPVSRNTAWRNIVISTAPPAPHAGLLERTDVIDGGTAFGTSAGSIDGGKVLTTPDIIDGGRAA